MSPASDGETAEQEAQRVANAVYRAICEMVIRGVCTMDGAMAGLRWATITLQAATEIKGYDTGRVDETVDRLMGALDAVNNKGRMQ